MFHAKEHNIYGLRFVMSLYGFFILDISRSWVAYPYVIVLSQTRDTHYVLNIYQTELVTNVIHLGHDLFRHDGSLSFSIISPFLLYQLFQMQ